LIEQIQFGFLLAFEVKLFLSYDCDLLVVASHGEAGISISVAAENKDAPSSSIVHAAKLICILKEGILRCDDRVG
jgi:hypothetical protein